MTSATLKGNLDNKAFTYSINERNSASVKSRCGLRLCNSTFLILCLTMSYVGCVSVDDAPVELEGVRTHATAETVCVTSEIEDVCTSDEVEDEGVPSEVEDVCASDEVEYEGVSPGVEDVRSSVKSEIVKSDFLRDARALNTVLRKLVGHGLGEVPTKDYLGKHAKTKKVAQAIRTRTVELPNFNAGDSEAKNVLLEVDDDFGCVRTIEAIIFAGSASSADLMEPFEQAIGRASQTGLDQEGRDKMSFWLNDPDSGGHYYFYMTSSCEGIRLYATCSFNVITKLEVGEHARTFAWSKCKQSKVEKGKQK